MSDPNASFEVRNSTIKGKTKLDEVVARDVKSFHLEYMDEGSVWIGLSLQDGRFIHVRLFTNGKAHINGMVEIDEPRKYPLVTGCER